MEMLDIMFKRRSVAHDASFDNMMNFFLYTCANAIKPIDVSGQIRYPEKKEKGNRDGYEKNE
jgi:hypothetical protein